MHGGLPGCVVPIKPKEPKRRQQPCSNSMAAHATFHAHMSAPLRDSSRTMGSSAWSLSLSPLAAGLYCRAMPAAWLAQWRSARLKYWGGRAGLVGGVRGCVQPTAAPCSGREGCACHKAQLQVPAAAAARPRPGGNTLRTPALTHHARCEVVDRKRGGRVGVDL